MKRIALITLAVAALAVAGCATDYKHYAKAHEVAAQATGVAEAARYKALGELGCSTNYVFDAAGKKIERQETKCDPETQRMAGMMLGIERLIGKQAGAMPALAEPYSFKDVIRDVAALAVPLANAGVTAYSVRKGGDVAIAQSNNARGIAESTNNTMRGLASDGFAAASALGARATTQITVTGDNNTTAGRDATTTTTNRTDCPQTADARGGGSGNSGNGAPGGNGAQGGASGQTGAGAPATITQTTNCTAGK